MESDNEEETKENKTAYTKNECRCPPLEVSTDVSSGFTKLLNTLPSYVTLVDFGEVMPGKKAIQMIEIENEDNFHKAYNIQNVSHMNKMFQFFRMNRYNFTIPPNEKTKVQITYAPLMENEKSSALYNILCSNNESQEIRKVWLKGRCHGTSVKCSTNKLYFLITSSVKIRKRTFELTNISEIPAQFELEQDEHDEIFRVEPANGEIQPQRNVYVNMTFNDETKGLHYRRLVVIIDKHEPIMIDVVGLKSNTNFSMERLKDMKFYPREVHSNYSAYFNDYGFSDLKYPLFQLKRSHLDFGRCSKEERENVLVAIIKNFMNDDIKLKWYKDPENVFLIRPSESVIHANQIGYFEVTFKPHCSNHTYYKTIMAQVNWTNESNASQTTLEMMSKSEKDDQPTETIPIPLSLTLTGYSFPENRSIITKVEVIPQIVTLPACLPNFNSYVTFKMQSGSHLPVLFKFVAPKNSNFDVKPKTGLVRKRKLLVAKMVGTNTPKIYEEDWKLEFNGRQDRSMKVTFRGLIEAPSIVIGDNNVIVFSSTLPDCHNTGIIPVRNTCCFSLRVSFIGENEFYSVNPKSFLLYPDEIVNIEWTFNGNPDVPEESKMKYTMQAITNLEEVIGMPFEMEVTLKAHCEFSQICVTPRYMDFEDLALGSYREVEFTMFNFGKTSIPYTLRAVPLTGDFSREKIKINVETGELLSNQHVSVKVSFETRTEKEHLAQIVYYTRINGSSQSLTGHPPIDLFSLRYNCIIPTLQVEEIVEHTLGSIFSKLDIWNMLAINDLNVKLLNIGEKETQAVHFKLPSVECHDKIHKIKFVLRNTTKFDVNATLSRVKTCKCPPMEATKNISLRRQVFDCPHKSLITMELSDETIVGYSFQFLDLILNFKMPMSEEMTYDMQLTENKHIIFIFRFNNIPKGIPYLSPYKESLKRNFLNIFIGAKVPPYQMFWLYNNTSLPSHYYMNTEVLVALQKKEGFPVISCFNPEGTVEPHSAKSVLLRFQPIEAKVYQVNLPLTLGEKIYNLTISGSGKYKYDHHLIYNYTTKMPIISLKMGDVPVTLSIDYLLLEPFLLWNTMEKLIYIRNSSKDHTMEYTWQKCLIEDIIEITADKPTGILEPEAVVGIILQFKAFGNPAVAMINLSCKVVDITEREIYEKSIKILEENKKQIGQHFTIDDGGSCTTHQESEMIIEPPSDDFYLTITISFHTISMLEASQYVEIGQYLTQNPHESFQIDMENFIESLLTTKDSGEEVSVNQETPTDPYVCQVMECLIMDTLKSQMFQEMISCQSKATPPYYIQFKEEESVRNKEAAKMARMTELKKFYAKSTTLKDFSAVIKDMMKETLREIYF